VAVEKFGIAGFLMKPVFDSVRRDSHHVHQEIHWNANVYHRESGDVVACRSYSRRADDWYLDEASSSVLIYEQLKVQLLT